MAERLSLLQLADYSIEELRALPEDMRPVSRSSGQPLREPAWSLAIKRAHPKEFTARTVREPRTPRQPKAEGPLVTSDPLDKQFEALKLNKSELATIADAKKMAAALGVTSKTIADNIYGGHQIVGTLTREPMVAIPRDEADAMGEAIFLVVIRYNLVWLFKHMPLITCLTVCGMIEYNTVARVRDARTERRRIVQAGPQGIIPRPRVVPPQRQPEAVEVPETVEPDHPVESDEDHPHAEPAMPAPREVTTNGRRPSNVPAPPPDDVPFAARVAATPTADPNFAGEP